MFPIQMKSTFVRSRAVKLIATTCVFVVIAGCVGSYGRFDLDVGVGQAFREGSLPPGYRYYYAGRDTMPYAMMGIDRAYSVPSRHWIPFVPEPEMLTKMSDNMYGKMGYPPTGAQILDPEGHVIGIWFSSLNTQSVRVDSQQRTVEVLFRNPENSRSLSLGLAGGDS